MEAFDIYYKLAYILHRPVADNQNHVMQAFQSLTRSVFMIETIKERQANETELAPSVCL